MESRLSVYIFLFMRANKIEPSQLFADRVGVGWNWLRSLYGRRGAGNPTSVPLQKLHDYLVENQGMECLIAAPDNVSESDLCIAKEKAA